MIGQRLGHYRLIDKLGRGGMGEVYRAEDLRLKRRVALKVLPEHLAGDRDSLARLQREAESLAALDHPNIVAIFSVEEATVSEAPLPRPILFLTMQLIEGHRLADEISADGASLERIFEVGLALSDALQAAHDKGIVHRDLKPANVMVCEDGRIKVLDFGLAKSIRPVSSQVDTGDDTGLLTRAGSLLGTLPYMAPEQLEGRGVDVRSDLFSLGVILYEIATGRRPFESESSSALISSILRDQPPDVDVVRPHLPHHLGRIVRRCLEKVPDRRFQSARAIRNELEDLASELQRAPTSATTSSSGEPPSPQRAPVELATTRSPIRRGWPILLALAAFGVVVLWVVAPSREPAQSSPRDQLRAAADEPLAAVPEAELRLAVLPFENLGDPDEGYFADGITEEISSRLAGVHSLGVVSRKSAALYAGSDKTLQQVGKELGVDYVIEGTVRWASGADGAGTVRVTPQLIRVSDDLTVWAGSYDRQLQDIFAVQTDIAEKVIDQLGIRLLGTEAAALEKRPTSNIAAYQAFLRGRDSYWSSDVEEAIRLLRRAVELDPEFVEAWAMLSATYSRAHLTASGVQAAEGARAALDQAKRLAPSRPLVRWAEAVFLYHVDRRYDDAAQILEGLVRERPSESESWLMLGAIRRRQSRWDEAQRAMERSVALTPRDENTLWELGGTYLGNHRYREADETYARAIDHAPDAGGSYTYRAWMRPYWNGDLDFARSVLESAPQYNWSIWVDAWLSYLARRFPEALSRLEDLKDPSGGTEQAFVASKPLWLFVSGAREAARRSASDLLSTVESQASSTQHHAILARAVQLEAILGRAELAVERARQLEGVVEPDGLVRAQTKVELAKAYLILDARDQAIRLLTESHNDRGSFNASSSYLRLDPMWDPLRDDPRFTSLVQ